MTNQDSVSQNPLLIYLFVCVLSSATVLGVSWLLVDWYMCMYLTASHIIYKYNEIQNKQDVEIKPASC